MKEIDILKKYIASKLYQETGEKPMQAEEIAAIDNLKKKAIAELTQRQNSLMEQIQNNMKDINRHSEDIRQKDKEIEEKMVRGQLQRREIDFKQNLVLTRNRMLQLSQEKNVYKKKIIYTISSVIIFLVLIMLSTYIYFSKTK